MDSHLLGHGEWAILLAALLPNNLFAPRVVRESDQDIHAAPYEKTDVPAMQMNESTYLGPREPRQKPANKAEIGDRCGQSSGRPVDVLSIRNATCKHTLNKSNVPRVKFSLDSFIVSHSSARRTRSNLASQGAKGDLKIQVPVFRYR